MSNSTSTSSPPPPPSPPPRPSPPQPMTPTDIQDASTRLSQSPMFRHVPPTELHHLAHKMHKLFYNRNDLLVSQDQPVDHMLIMSHGYARRLRKGRDGVERHLDTRGDGSLISELHVVGGGGEYASAKCVTENCAAFALNRDVFRGLLESRTGLATGVIEGLSDDVREKTRRFRTPLLSQRPTEINFAAVSVAAVTESYYRSALNSLLNQRLSGISSPLFPNMHVQVPARVLYIAGFKGLRAMFDQHIDPDQWNTHASRTAVRFANMFAPGIVMTPISSVLEACNVGHTNPEPLLRRSTRGMLPRGGREVIFGVGLNQVSDYFEERYRSITPNSMVANMAGSLTAGVIAGYLSHVPHNISTYKLMEPDKPYGQLFKMFVDKSVPDHLIPKNLPRSMLPLTKGLMACLFPRGVLIRTVQICGSFALLNGIIALIDKDNRRRMGKAIDEAVEASEEEGEEEGEEIDGQWREPNATDGKN